MQQGDPTSDQLRQLYLYAVLVHDTRGEWPSEVSIENASGEQVSTALDPALAEQARQEVLVAVGDLNCHADGRALLDAASPGEETCRWCAYGAGCPAYWRDLRVDWGHRSVRGRVRSAGLSESATFVSLEVVSPLDQAEEVVHLCALALELPGEATWISAVDLAVVRGTSEMAGKWWTRIAVS